MKNRFYGDVNDYIKYGILDVLSKNYDSIGINWYLTDNQHGNQKHGNDTRYLSKRDKWNSYNPRIFKLLEQRVITNQRNISFCKTDGVISFQAEYAKQLPDNVQSGIYQKERRVWHQNALTTLNDCKLVFFDPDIGIKKQLVKDPIRASEHCDLNEITDYHWCDWLIVIFLGRLSRFKQLKNNPIVISAAQNEKKVMVFLYGRMALLYVSSSIQANILSKVFEEWDTKIETKILVP